MAGTRRPTGGMRLGAWGVATVTGVMAGGPSEVTLEGQEHTGVEGRSVFTTAGWAPGVTGFDIDATAGVSQITVTARSG